MSGGAVERHSIIENKESTQRFLINRMQSDSDNSISNDNGLKARKKTTLHVNISVPNGSSSSNGYQNGVIANDDNRVYVVEARPCFIEREVPKPGKIAAMSTHNIIAREIEECRQREEELKQLRLEAFVQELGTPSPIPQTPTVVFSPAALQMRMGVSTTNGYFENDFQQQQPAVALSEGDPFDAEDKGMNDGQSYSIEDVRIKVRPLVDDSDEDEVPFYKISSESAVEKDIRLAKEREEELRREKEAAAAQKLPRPKSTDDADVNVSTSTLEVVLSPNTSPALAPLLIQTDDQSDRCTRTETLLLMKATPVDEQPRSPSVESQIHSSPSSTVSFVSTSPSPQTDVGKKQRSLASARLQQEINEVLQKELELREAGAIATTSQDRTDDKVISLRQYPEISAPKSVPPLQQSVPMSAPPLSSTKFFPNVRNAAPDYKPQGGTLGRHNSAAVKNGPNMGIHSSLPKGAMAKFIASRGKCQPISVFVPKVPKQPLLPVEATTVTPPQQHTQEIQLRDSTEKATHRRSLSTVESKILEELREMKLREEELRKLRINSKSGSLETLDGDSSSETSGHAELHSEETTTEVTNGHY